MKKSLLLLSLLFVTLIQACSLIGSGEEKTGSLVGQVEEKTGSLVGQVYDVYEGNSYNISGADIIVDGVILTQSDDGKFKLSLKEGTYTMKIETPYHETKEVKFKIEGDRKEYISIELTTIYAEYFPLALGNEWYYSHSGFKTNDREDNKYKGSRKLLISEVTYEGEDILYSFEISDTVISYLDYDSWDSENEKVIRVQDTTYTYESYTGIISEKENGQLDVVSGMNPFFVLGQVFTSWDEEGRQTVTPLLRYLPFSRFKEKIEIMAGGTSAYPGHVTVEKGKGVVVAGYGGGHLDKYSHSYKLQSTNFK